jgi:hypothetical protein
MRCLVVFLALAAMLSLSAAEDVFQTADFVQQHLKSIGTEQARAAVKNRVAKGTVSWEQMSGAGRWDGKQVMASEGNKLSCLLELAKPRYPGERFVSDGKKTFVADSSPGVLSPLGMLVHNYPQILTEGLWGGTLSTAWPLAHLEERNAKVQDKGLKKVDGRELHRIDYIPKKYNDLEIQLYFEVETFRHVTTIYYPRGHWGQCCRLEERFADFKSVDNVTLPERWTIRLSGNSLTEFEVTQTNISHNVRINPKNFEVK